MTIIRNALWTDVLVLRCVVCAILLQCPDTYRGVRAIVAMQAQWTGQELTGSKSNTRLKPGVSL